jgi:hypothetical protein
MKVQSTFLVKENAMPSTYITLGRDEHAALVADALAELRPPRDHARWLLRRALKERGLVTIGAS